MLTVAPYTKAALSRRVMGADSQAGIPQHVGSEGGGSAGSSGSVSACSACATPAPALLSPPGTLPRPSGAEAMVLTAVEGRAVSAGW